MTEERLQKVMAHAGVASRRESETMIEAGRVRVNGQVVTALGTKVDPQEDHILVDGEPISLEKKAYVLLYKPPGAISTVDDPRGRRTVVDLVNVEQRVYPIGRLDADSEGLIMLTNDGKLTHRLTHPSFEHEKEYRVLVGGRPTGEILRRLRQGIALEDGPTAPAEVDRVGREGDGTWLRFVIHEGRKRQIRRMADAVGHPVRRLIRVRMGPIRLGDLSPGQWRHLDDREIEALRRAVGIGSQ